MRNGVVAFATDVARCVRFYSRIPVSALPGETDIHAIPDFTRMPRGLPLASAMIALPAVAILALSGAAGLPAIVSAVLAIAALVLTTGAFHEDGLADTADGFGGGHTLARKLEIMRDSRIGTYGGAALVLSLLLRVVALAEIRALGGTGLACALVLALAVLSRCAGLMPIALLEAARTDGASANVGRPSQRLLAAVFVAAWLLAMLALALVGPLFDAIEWHDGALLATILALVSLAAGGGLTLLSRRMIGGQTGDVAGAAQQIAECAGLVTALALLPGLMA